MPTRYGINVFTMEHGERYCHVINLGTGLPEYYPNLFLTTQSRNKSDAYNTVEALASNLVVFLRFLEHYEINLEKRVLTREFFREHELDALRDYTQYRFNVPSKPSIAYAVSDFNKSRGSKKSVCDVTQYSRLTTISRYLDWFSRQIMNESSKKDVDQVLSAVTRIKARRPLKKRRNGNLQSKALSDRQLDALFETIRPGSVHNPFIPSVQKRNRVMILFLYHLGIRGGELLNLRISDIDFASGQVRIVRRSDDKNDHRKKEPNVKTQERILPMNDSLVKEVHDYVMKDRRLIKNARKNDFLFVTYKKGPTVGKPISKSGYHKVISVVSGVSPQLYEVTGHCLRHTWNDKFSEKMDAMDEPFSEAREEQLRSYLMGWKEASGTAAIYNKRHIERKAQIAGLAMQDKNGTRAPKGVNENE